MKLIFWRIWIVFSTLNNMLHLFFFIPDAGNYFLEVLLPVLTFFRATPYIKSVWNVLNGSIYFPVSYTHDFKIFEKFVVKHWSYAPLKIGGSMPFLKKRTSKQKKKGTCFINHINFSIQICYIRMLSFRKVQSWKKSLTESDKIL